MMPDDCRKAHATAYWSIVDDLTALADEDCGARVVGDTCTEIETARGALVVAIDAARLAAADLESTGGAKRATLRRLDRAIAGLAAVLADIGDTP